MALVQSKTFLSRLIPNVAAPWSVLKHGFLPNILLPLCHFFLCSSLYSCKGYFKSPFSLLTFFLLFSSDFFFFFSPFSSLAASAFPPPFMRRVWSFADFKARERCDGLVWTLQLPSINPLNYCMSFRNKTELYLSSLGTLSPCSIFGSYLKKSSFSNFLFCHVGTYLNWDNPSSSQFHALAALLLHFSVSSEHDFLTSALQIPLRTPLSWAFKFLQSAMCDCQVNLSPQH